MKIQGNHRDRLLRNMQYFNIFPIIVAIVLPALSLCGCKKEGDLAKLPAAGAKSSTDPRQVRTARISSAVTSDLIKATGTTRALSRTSVKPLVPGLIVRLTVREGDRIKKGQVLVQLDTRGMKLGLRQARVAVEMAEVGVSAAKRERGRFEKLLRGGASTQAQVDQISDKYLGAAAGLKQARIAVEMAEQALRDSSLRAPYNGIVVEKMVSLGDYATSMPPTILFTLMETHTLELYISLPEPELGRVREGSPVTAHFKSISRTMEGKIARIVNNVDSMTRSFTAIMEVPNKDLSLKPGLFAQVEVKTSAPRRRILVPKEAVMDEGSGVYAVYLTDGKRARRRAVQITESGKGKTEVMDGLKAGETLILDPAGLSDGEAVEVTPAERAAAPAGKQVVGNNAVKR